MNYINNLGEFDSLADVWKEYPHGGKEGDYVVINGVNIAWNKYTSNWGEDTNMPDVNEEVNGDFLVKGDLRVGGEVINKDLKWIKEATVLNKGYFKTAEDLKKSYPAATAGSKAYVGSDYPYAIYLWDGKNAAWVDSGEYFDDSLRNKGYFATVEALQAAYPIAVSGSKAYVGVTYPFAIYLWDATTSTWMDSGETGGEESVNLGDYYTKEETDAKVAELESEVDTDISEINIKLGINEQHTYTSDDFCELYYRPNDNGEDGVFVDYTSLDYSGIIIPLKKGAAYSKVGMSSGINYWILTKEKPSNGASAPNVQIPGWPYVADGTYNYLFLNVKMSSFEGVTLTEYAGGFSNEIQELETALNRTDNQLTEVANIIETITFAEIGEELTSADASSNVLISPSNGKETAYDGARASGYISVVGRSSIYISASMAWSNVLYAFYDANKTFIEGRASAGGSTITTMLNEKVAVPANAAYVRVCDYSYAQKGKVYAEKKVVGIKDWIGKKWVCVGDSLTEKNSRATMNYHDYVAEATGIEVVNMGVSGTGYKRQEESGNAFYQRVENIPTDADVITIFGSGNDGAYWGSQLGTASDATTDTIGGCMNITIDNILARMPLAVIGIVSPCPWGSYPPSTNNAMKRYSALLKQICERRGIPFLDLYLNSGLRPWDATFRELAYSRDEGGSVHPDENGHKLIAPRFKAFLETLIFVA